MTVDAAGGPELEKVTGRRFGVLADVLAARASLDGDRLAYDDGAQRVTFGELAENAAARARGLARMGVVPRDRVALTMAPGVAFAEVFWGLQLLGAAPCVLSPAAKPPTLARRVEMIRPRLVVDDATAAGLSAPGGPAPQTEIGGDDVAFIQLTSGTSGDPRAAVVRHRHALAFFRTARDAAEVLDTDVLVAWVPPWHDLGLVRFVIGAVYHGASCHIVQPAISTIPDWLRTVSRVGGTVSGAPDFVYRLATRMVDPATVDLSCLRYTTNGGEPVRRSTIEAFERYFGVANVVAPGYGLAEVTLGVSGHPAGEPIAVDDRGNVSSGRPLPGIEVRAGRDVAAPEEILVRSDAIFAGYLDAPDESRERVRDGWLHTGDSGYLDSEGRLYVLGRRRGMLKRAGSVVAPRELEEAAQQVPEVRVAAAVGLGATHAGGDAITVVVEAKDGSRGSEEIAGDVTRRIAEWAGFAPDRVVVTPPRSIPRTENGKLRHDHLREALLAGLLM
jgi:acyl-CoA synthetase (AMP-forming)/AMP-acid ligase II